MAEVLLRRPEIAPRGTQRAGAGDVAKVVRAEIGEARFLGRALELVVEGLRRDGVALALTRPALVRRAT